MAMKSGIAAGMIFLASSLSYGQRESLSLDGPWEFAIDSAGVGMPDGWFRTGIPKAFRRMVTVPHTWNVDAGTEEYQGVGWYEKRIHVPATWSGRAIRLEFGAVYHTAKVWINGALTGEHRGSGYTPFTIDGTGRLVAGTENSIVLRVDNAFSRSTIPFRHLYDWPTDGGIIRPVSIVATQRPGIGKIRVEAVPRPGGDPAGLSGTVGIVVRMTDAGGIDPGRIRCAVRVYEARADGQRVRVAGEYRPEIKNDEASMHLSMDSVNVWRFDSPALYRLHISLMVNGIRTDSLSATFGFREFRTERSQLFMNGEPIRLMGVEWMPGSNPRYGMAEPPAEAELMLGRMRSVNAIFTRFHWQQSDKVLDWCDRHGIIVQEELPLWGYGVPLNDTVMALARLQLREMIGAHYNHPSVAMWGVGNELESTRPSMIDSVRALILYAKSLDGNRLVNYVSNRLSLGEGPDASGVGDILMWNEYQDTWYLSDPAAIGTLLDSIHAAYPDKPMMITEYGLCEPANQGGDERRLRDMIYHTAVFESKRYIAGAIYFSLNDFRTHFGEEGAGVRKRRVHGVFDIDGVAKPSAAVLAGLSSPVEILNVGWYTGHRLEIAVIASSGLPSHPLRGYTLYWSVPGEDFRTRGIAVRIPDLLPGEKFRVPLDVVPGPEVDIIVVRPTGEIVARRTFEIRN